MTKPLSATLVELIASCRPHHPARPNILNTLLTIQQAQGYVPLAAIPLIARALGATEADVAGVLSYYPDLRTVAPGRHVIRVCMGESCKANHNLAVFRAVQAHLARGVGGTSGADAFTLEKVYCMGNCALAPTVAVDGDVHGRVAPDRIPALLERYR